MWLKRNFISIIGIILSIVAVCLSTIRIEPIDFNNESMLSLSIGLMSISATIMVASQIAGLRMSESKMQSMINSELLKLKSNAHNITIKSLFRTETVVATIVAEKCLWDAYTYQIELLTSYALDIKDSKLANDLSIILIKTEKQYRFYSTMNENEKKRIYTCIISIIKLIDNPDIILNTFYRPLTYNSIK